MTQTFKQDNLSSLKVVYLRVVSSLGFFLFYHSDRNKSRIFTKRYVSWGPTLLLPWWKTGRSADGD